MASRLKLGVLISGRGSNLQALIEACARPDYPAEIVLVVSNQPDAQGLARARAAGIPNQVINHRDFADREGFDAAMDRELNAHGAELICLAGFMRLLSTTFAESWRDKVINIHPSLLPAFRGLHAQRQALEAGVRITGCTVHFVRPALDDGPVIVQAAVPVLDGDTEDSLSARVLALEHRCYPAAVRLIAEGRLRVVGDRAEIDGAEGSDRPLFSPSIENSE
jgi:phosphoribosylglycinamide formyltransferase-1